MTENPTAERYLADLDRALRDVDAETARDIRSGIAEELRGLDPDDVGDRIASLGDPWAIARAARSEASRPAELPRVRGWMVPVTTLTVAFGGAIVPVIGWLVGIGLLWSTGLWAKREKILATVAPLVVGGVVVLVHWLTLRGGAGDSADNGFSAPSVQEFAFPAHYDLIWSGVIGAVVVNVVVAGWLAILGARRLARAESRLNGGA